MRATSTGSSRPRPRATRRPSSSRSARSTPASTRSKAPACSTALAEIDTDNAQGELYLPDVLPKLREAGKTIGAHVVSDHTLTLGVNDRVELAHARKLAQQRIHDAHARNGVTIVDPDSTLIDVGVTIGRDTIDRAEHVHPWRHDDRRRLRDRPADDADRLDAGRRRQRPALLPVSARVDDFGTIGPFAYLRPDAHLHPNAKAGAFVEIKNSTIGKGSKVPHLSYIGDADVGENTNIGAGNITANYDGRTKHRTTIGANVRTSVDTAFVAPVSVGDERVHRRGQRDHRRHSGQGARRRPLPAEEHPGLCGPAQAVTTGGPRTLPHVVSALSPRTSSATSLPLSGYDKRLMLFSGRSNPELAAKIANKLGPRARRRDAEDVLQRRGLLPLRGVDPRRGRLHRPADVRQRGHRRDRQRRADGAAGDDRRGRRRLGAPRDRRHAVVRLQPPGQEVRSARADLRPPRRPHARGRGRRSRADDGPPRRPGAGLLPEAGGPHDRDLHPHAVLPRPAPRGPRRGVSRRRPREAGQEVRREGRRRAGDPQQGAPGPAGRRDRLRDRRRQGQDRRDRRRHHRHRRNAARRGGDGQGRGREAPSTPPPPIRSCRATRSRTSPPARSSGSSSPTRSRCSPARRTTSPCSRSPTC